jgi:hypothetical protein
MSNGGVGRSAELVRWTLAIGYSYSTELNETSLVIAIISKIELSSPDSTKGTKQTNWFLPKFKKHRAGSMLFAPSTGSCAGLPQAETGAAADARSRAIDKSMLAIPEPRRVRDHDHVKSVAQHPCLICGRRPVDAHHLRSAQSRALGRKVSDEFTVPLCRGHHRELHRSGDEVTWWRKAGIDPTVAARALWLETHPLPERREDVATALRREVDKPTARKL